MKYWREIVEENLPYEEAKKHIRNYPALAFITRKEWDGVHFYSKKLVYCILLNTGEVIENCDDIYCKDSNDWMIVTPNYKTLEWLSGLKYINKPLGTKSADALKTEKEISEIHRKIRRRTILSKVKKEEM